MLHTCCSAGRASARKIQLEAGQEEDSPDPGQSEDLASDLLYRQLIGVNEVRCKPIGVLRVHEHRASLSRMLSVPS